MAHNAVDGCIEPAIEPMYRSSNAIVYQGDVLTVLPQLAPASVHAVIADPPYCSGGTTNASRSKSTRSKYVSGGAKHQLPDFAGDQRDQRSFTYWSTLWLAHSLHATVTGGACMVFTDWRQLPATSDALQAAGWTWRGVIIWHKPGARPQRGRFTNAAEYIIWGSNGPMTHGPAPLCLPGIYSVGPPRIRTHITEKPVQLLQDLMHVSPPNSTILDPFAGSGSTGVAAITTDRRYIGIELSRHYAEQTAARLHAIEHGQTHSDPGGA